LAQSNKSRTGAKRLRSGEILGNSDRHATPVALSGHIGQNWIGRIGVTPTTAPFGQLIGLARHEGCGVRGKEEAIMLSGLSSVGFPPASPTLEKFGFKFSSGGAHISRTMMLAELGAVLANVPPGSGAADYREAILGQNVLGKTTDSTRQKSLRHLRELYSLDESTPVFGLLRRLHATDTTSLPLLAVLVAWSRDPLLRATTPPIMDAAEGEQVDVASLAQALEAAFPGQYSELNRDKIARNAASSWTQSGHLTGRTKKIRERINPTIVGVTMAFFLGHVAGYHGAAVFSNPWCRLLDLNSDRAKAAGFDAHRAGLLNLHAVGEVVELSFPLLTEFQDYLT
jgi:hypothetical protein